MKLSDATWMAALWTLTWWMGPAHASPQGTSQAPVARAGETPVARGTTSHRAGERAANGSALGSGGAAPNPGGAAAGPGGPGGGPFGGGPFGGGPFGGGPFGGGSIPLPGPILPGPGGSLNCPHWLVDTAIAGGLIGASSAPTLGSLLPLGIHLFVGPSGNVGVGTLTPATRLQVSGGNVELRDHALNVRGSSTPLELGATLTNQVPHISDDRFELRGGLQPSAHFDDSHYDLRAGVATYGATFETGVGGGVGSGVRIHSAGPTGSGIEMGNLQSFQGSAGSGAGRWEVANPSDGSSFVLDGGSADDEGHLQVRYSGGQSALHFDASSDAVGGGELTMGTPGGDEVVALRASSGTVPNLALRGPDLLTGLPDGAGVEIDAGVSGAHGASMHLYRKDFGATFQAESVLTFGGGQFTLENSAGDTTVLSSAVSTASSAGASFQLWNHVLPGVFTSALVEAPTATLAPVFRLAANDNTSDVVSFLGIKTSTSFGSSLEITENGVVRARFLDNAFGLYNSAGELTIYNDGNSGFKSAVVRVGGELRQVFCNEGAEVWVEDAGQVRLEGGRAEVPLDPIYLQLIHVDDAHPMNVSASPRGASPGLWVEKLDDRIVVHEIEGGRGDGLVDWRVQAVRKGRQGARLAPVAPCAPALDAPHSGD